VEVEGCPIRKEVIAGVIDDNDDINLSVWRGPGWGNQKTFTLLADKNFKCFDIAYESQSGNALVVGREGTGTPLLYNIWDGSQWTFSSPQVAFSLPGGEVHDVVMTSQPGGNEILIAVVTAWDDIQLVRWNGVIFTDLGTIETQVAYNDFRMVEIVYEHYSGDAMVVWSRNTDSALKYRMWNGSVLGPEGDVPDFGGNENQVIRGAADSDPASDYIVIAAVDNFYDINVAVWDGDAWVDSHQVETAAATNVTQSFDVAWEAAGEDVVIAWAPWTATNVRYLVWKKGVALVHCTIKEGPDLQQQPWTVRLQPIAGTEKIVLLGETTSNDLRYCLWIGDQFKGNPAVLLEPDVPVQNDIAYDLAEADVPRTGGSGSAPASNQAPEVDAGPNETICLPTNEATLSGTVLDDGLPNPPGAVTTTWSKESGPGTVTFNDASLTDAVATFSAVGTYVLRLTADDSHLADFDEVTITVSETPYVETYETWSATSDGSWELIDLSGSPFNVPANALIEVAITNRRMGNEYEGGVRAVGSSLERRFKLHEAEGGGKDVVVMHVQANEASQIECYAKHTSYVEFTLLGYWTCSTYVETFYDFKAGASGSWQDHNLGAYGVGPGQVGEIVIANTNSSNEYRGGVQPVGPDLGRTLSIHEAESGGVDTATMLVTADNTASATVQLWAESNSSIDFYLVGYWSDPSGTYTDSVGLINSTGGPSADRTWEDKNLSSMGVPANAVVQIAIVNTNNSVERELGLRETGSSLSRMLDFQEAEGGPGDTASFHVNADENATIQWYDESVGEGHDFNLLGWWVLP
jgi:hypothetical protein